MRVLLQDRISRRYYAGPQRWVEARDEAMDFGQIELAAKAYTEESARYAEIIVDDGALPEGASEPHARAAEQPHSRRSGP